jgi:hypothetical protein
MSADDAFGSTGSKSEELQGDGVRTALYHSLWDEKDKGDPQAKIYIPDTILIQSGALVDWYFTGVKGSVLRKRTSNTTVEQIERCFKKKSHDATELVAYFISMSSSSSSTGENNKSDIVEYMSSEGLNKFLLKGRLERSGILQRFVQPKGTRNDMLSAVWTPALCLLERRVNRSYMHEDKKSIAARAVTFDASEAHSTSVPVQGCALARAIQTLCCNVVDRIRTTSKGKHEVSRLILNLKVDGRGRIFLLWASSIRLDYCSHGSNEEVPYFSVARKSSAPVKLSHAVQLREEEKLALARSPKRKNTPSGCSDLADWACHAGSNFCPSCGVAESCLPGVERFYPIPYKTVIAHFEKMVVLMQQQALLKSDGDGGHIRWPPDSSTIQAASNVGLGFGPLVPGIKSAQRQLVVSDKDFANVIPPVIMKLRPRLGVSGYNRFRRDTDFLGTGCMVCENCFLAYVELSTDSLQLPLPLPIPVAKNASVKPKKDKGMPKVTIPIPFR